MKQHDTIQRKLQSNKLLEIKKKKNNCSIKSVLKNPIKEVKNIINKIPQKVG